MLENRYGGLLVAFDGPNGAGKSTLIRKIGHQLAELGLEVFLTREPTDTRLGLFMREISESIDGESLACLVASDRYLHLKETIIPQLTAGKIVITDRYVLSSLIFQCMDNVPAEFVLAINEHIVMPDIQFAVRAEIATLQARLHRRWSLTRFEEGERSEEELKFMAMGISLLRERKINVEEIDTMKSINKNASLIMSRILKGRTGFA